jgi:hypothetical protein
MYGYLSNQTRSQQKFENPTGKKLSEMIVNNY